MDIETFLASRPYSNNTKDRYRRILREFVNLPDIQSWTPAQLLQFVQKTAWGNSMQCLALETCKIYLRSAFGDDHPALAARIKRLPTPPQPRLSVNQALDLLVSFAQTDEGRRDLALACVALDTSLRVTELCNLEIGNIHLQDCKLFALVKGGQWMWKPFSPETAEYIAAWQDVRQPAIGVSNLFISFHHQRRGQALTRAGVQHIMEGWGKRIGVHISPHMFRRSFASISTILGTPKNIVKDGGGWKSDDMVNHYIGDLDIEHRRAFLPVKKLHGG